MQPTDLDEAAATAAAAHAGDAVQALLELTAIFENTSVGILFTRDRVFHRCNRRAAEILGYDDPHSLIGKPAITIFPDEQSYQLIGAQAGPLLAAGGSFRSDWLFRKADGSLFWCSVHAKAIDPQHTERGTVWVVDDVTEARQAAQALRHSNAVLHDTLEHMDQGITIVDSDLIAQAVNRRFRELYDLPEAMCKPGTPFEDFVRNVAERGDYGPGEVEEQVRTRVELARRFEPHHFERERLDGTIVEVRGMPITGGRGFVTVYTDVTQRARAERALRESEARFRSLTALSSDWYWEQDTEFRYSRLEGRHANGDPAAFASELGKTDGELGFEVEGGRESHLALIAAAQPFHDVVMRREFADGELRYVRVSGEPTFDSLGRFTGYRGVGRDITPQKRAEERIQYLATHDGLTGLPNRTMFVQLLNNKIQTARRYDARFALMYIDLDRFKLINDTLGHEAGDFLLEEMAARFAACLRASDVVARFGGDEFVVLVQEVSDNEQVATVASKLLAAASQRVQILGQECRVTASVGICMYPQEAADEQSLMKNADTAMYRAKALGKNNFQFYSKELETQSLDRKAFELSMRRALQRNEFSLDYQAKLDLKTGAITGVEALLRWQHPGRGTLLPGQFMALAEDTGLIVAIGKWVLRAACAQSMAWQRDGLPPVCVSVNISARQFSDELANDITDALTASGMDAGLLELELAESTIMANPARALRLVRALKQLGVRIAIDDFGTGYSTLAQVKRFPIDTLKVDRSFIRDLASDSKSGAITRAIIAMGKTLSLTVIAGGVETEEQRSLLSEQACDVIQGYQFSRPVGPEQFADLLRRHVPSPRD